MPETFKRNAERHNIEGSLWNPAIAAEVACYFINDEVNISLSQLRDVFIGEFSSIGFVWNRDPGGARVVYDRANQLREDALSQLPETDSFKGYLWPGPEDSFLWYKWGIQMWYGSFHNGIDVAIPGLKTFDVLAISTGVARYYDGGSCNMGVIHFKSIKNEEFYYVHMSAEPSDIYIPTNGSWVPVLTGQKLGRIHEGDTTCSIGSHLHFMYTDGRYIGEEMFNR
jgi:murein DD-endopeptidase MepM/ murein hydrolase activator NlpD